MIIDFHTHLFPEKIAKAAIKKLSESSDVIPFTEGTVQALRKNMRKCLVDFSVTLPVATNPDSVPSMNDFAILLSSVSGIISFGAIHPEYSHWKEELRRIKSAGLRGIKLHPDYQGVFISDPRIVDIIRECGRLGLVVIVHAGLDLAFPDCVHCTPEMIAHILPDIRGSVFVAAHFGGFRLETEVLRHLAGHDLYLDTSFSHAYSPEACSEILRRHRSDRLLFASDSPWGCPAETADFIRKANLSPDAQNRIFSGNALDCLNCR